MDSNGDRKRVVIAGGSGFVGVGLSSRLLVAGYAVTILTRKSGLVGGAGVDSVSWDGRSAGAWMDALDGAEALVNLTGKSVDCTKNPVNCDEILRSRVEPTRMEPGWRRGGGEMDLPNATLLQCSGAGEV